MLPESGLTGLEQLMFERAGVSHEEREVFLTPDFEDLHDPFLFQDMNLAVELILQVRDNGGKILIYGDYDCDGLTATALMLRFFKKAGIQADYMIPNRLEEGYSLNPKAVREIIHMKPDLVLTVDCGSSSREEIMELMEAGIPVILTDHHQVPDDVPYPIAFINPCKPGETYPNRSLAGVGVAFKLVQALSIRLFPEESPAAWLPFAAVGTVSDAMTLLGENRSIVQLGLKVFRNFAPIGLLRLAEQVSGEEEFTAETISYGIAPRLNAAGRMGDTEPAMRLLMCDDERGADDGVEVLNELNEERRKLELQTLAEAVRQIEKMKAEDRAHILLVADPHWHTGVLGIVSARLCEMYQLPAVCLGGAEDGLRGSARSPEGVDILQLLKSGEDLCESLGGHKQAAGLMVTEERLPAYFERVREAALCSSDHSADSTTTALCEIPHELFGEELLFTLRPFEPFGQHFEEPLFVFKEVEILTLRPVGDGKHLSFRLRLDDRRELTAIGFGIGALADLYRMGDRVDILGRVGEHIWNGRKELQIKVTDLRPAEEERKYHEQTLEKLESFNQKGFMPSVDEKAELGIRLRHIPFFWQWLEEKLQKGELIAEISLLARVLGLNLQEKISAANILNILRVFSEAGLLKMREEGIRVKLRMNPGQSGHRPSLSEQSTWIKLQQSGGIDHGRG